MQERSKHNPTLKHRESPRYSRNYFGMVGSHRRRSHNPVHPGQVGRIVPMPDLDAGGFQPCRQNIALLIAPGNAPALVFKMKSQPGHPHPADADKMHMARRAGHKMAHAIKIVSHKKNG